MLLIKTSGETLENVLREAKHALHGIPKGIKPGELLLVAQTKSTLLPGQKQIRWVMEYVDVYSDTGGETDRLWGRHWPYIIRATNVKSIEPFNLSEIQASNIDYRNVQTFCRLDPADEQAVLEWIGDDVEISRDEREDAAAEFQHGRTLDPDALIKKLDKRYAGSPTYVERVVRQIQRPSALRNAILLRDGYTCRICGEEGFKKKSGSKYAEVHHMIELNKSAPNTLQSWNVLVVCPTCHKKLHYADVTTKFLAPGWRININGKDHVIC